MYALECYANYYLPIKIGQFKVLGLEATVQDTSAPSRVVLIDDDSGIPLGEDYDIKKGLIDIKGLPNSKGILEINFPEPIVTRKGITIVQSTNIVGGTIKLWVR